MRIVMRGAAATALLALAGCQEPLKPPTAVGVCWRLADGLNGAQDFRPFATAVPDLENCAVKLEGAYLAHGKPMVGAFQGRMIFVEADAITTSSDSHSQRYRVFSPEQRAKIDAGYKALKEREAAGS